MMLVPALAFAWWLVSLPTPSTERLAERADLPARAASARADAVPQDAEDTTPDEAAPLEPTATDDGTEGTERVALKLVTPSIVQMARSFLDLPMGAERHVTIEGRRYVFVLERHYHPPGFVGGPNGWHKGVTAYGLR